MLLEEDVRGQSLNPGRLAHSTVTVAQNIGRIGLTVFTAQNSSFVDFSLKFAIKAALA